MKSPPAWCAVLSLSCLDALDLEGTSRTRVADANEREETSLDAHNSEVSSELCASLPFVGEAFPKGAASLFYSGVTLEIKTPLTLSGNPNSARIRAYSGGLGG